MTFEAATSLLKASATAEQRRGAIATCARKAVSVEDLAELLQMLGLDGSAVEIAEALPAAPAVESPPPEVAEELAEAWGTAAVLADELERALRVLTRLVDALTVAGCPRGAVPEAGRAWKFLESLPRAG